MEQKIIGEITDKKEIETKTGKVFWSISVAGTDMSTWEQEIYDKFNKGENVQATYTVKGKYKNLTMMIKADDVPSPEGEGEPITKAEQVNGHQKIKTITSLNPEEFDKLVNDFNNTHKVFATQTHIFRVKKAGDEVESLQYVAVIYWK